MTVLYILHEQIHWSLLMTGFFLADEPPFLPYPVNSYSTTSDVAASIAGQIFALFERAGDESNTKWSPQVIETLYWWLGRWGYTYLFAGDINDGHVFFVNGSGDWQRIACWCVSRMRKDVEGWIAEKGIILQVERP